VQYKLNFINKLTYYTIQTIISYLKRLKGFLKISHCLNLELDGYDFKRYLSPDAKSTIFVYYSTIIHIVSFSMKNDFSIIS